MSLVEKCRIGTFGIGTMLRTVANLQVEHTFFVNRDASLRFVEKPGRVQSAFLVLRGHSCVLNALRFEGCIDADELERIWHILRD